MDPANAYMPMMSGAVEPMMSDVGSESNSYQSMYECQPPITMLAAARVYRVHDAKPLPPFMSSTPKITVLN